MLDYASAKPQELASRKYTPEKKTFKALWKVSYRESFTILLGLSFKTKLIKSVLKSPIAFKTYLKTL